MTKRYTSQCQACQRLRSGSVCAAFPSGIPERIIAFGDDHRKPVPGDNGVVFKQKDTKKAREAFKQWSGSHPG